jgi:hypothetical protein
MNPFRQRLRVQVARADDDPSMLRDLAMADFEVPAIECHDRAAGCGCIGQDVAVADPLVPLSRLLHRQHIMPTPAKSLADLVVEIFVRVELTHEESSLFIVADRLIDFVGVHSVVVPRSPEIGRGEIRVALEDVGVGEAELAPFDEPPDGVARVANAGIAPTNLCGSLDPAVRRGRHEFS